MVIMIHHARTPEKTLLDLPPVVPAEFASGLTSACMQ
jgi:hypothetical protein